MQSNMNQAITDQAAADRARHCKYAFFAVLFVLLFLGTY